MCVWTGDGRLNQHTEKLLFPARKPREDLVAPPPLRGPLRLLCRRFDLFCEMISSRAISRAPAPEAMIVVVDSM